MFGDTLTVTLDGAGGTARVCNKINQDQYSAEYLNRISTDEIRVKIRHSKESAKPSTGELYPVERHNVLITQTVFATPSATEKFREISFTIRNRPDDAVLDVTNLGEAMCYFLTDTNLDKLYTWEV